LVQGWRRTAVVGRGTSLDGWHQYNPALLQALAAVRDREPATTALT